MYRFYYLYLSSILCCNSPNKHIEIVRISVRFWLVVQFMMQLKFNYCRMKLQTINFWRLWLAYPIMTSLRYVPYVPSVLYVSSVTIRTFLTLHALRWLETPLNSPTCSKWQIRGYVTRKLSENMFRRRTNKLIKLSTNTDYWEHSSSDPRGLHAVRASSGVVATALPSTMACRKMLFLSEIFDQKCKIWGWKSPIFETFLPKLKFWGPVFPRSGIFCSYLSDNCNPLPRPSAVDLQTVATL